MKSLQIVIIFIFSLSFILVNAQNRYYTKNGNVSFFSSAPLENIEAFNSSAVSIMDLQTGAIEFAILMKAFKFEKALMQEHFNENYLESSKFPKAIFKGKIVNIKDVFFELDGTYVATIKGKLTIHGITKDVTVPGQFTVEDQQITGVAQFPIRVSDYDIRIPRIVRDNIAQEVKVNVKFNYQVFRRTS